MRSGLLIFEWDNKRRKTEARSGNEGQGKGELGVRNTLSFVSKP